MSAFEPLKPIWQPEEISDRLRDLEITSLLSLTPHRTVYACEWVGQSVVLKLSGMPGINEAEDLAWQWLGQSLPVPKVVAAGLADQISWLLQARLEGDVLSDLSASEQLFYWPALCQLLTQLLAAPLPRWPLPQSVHEPWRDFLLRPQRLIWAQDYELSFCYQEPELLNDLFARLDHGLETLEHSGRFSSASPQWLLHGDFKPDNLIVLRGEIQGLIDWHECRSGDFIFDLAKLLTYFAPEQLPDLFKAYCQSLPEALAAAEDLKLRLKTCLVSLSLHKLLRYGEYPAEKAHHYQERLTWVRQLLPILDEL